MCHVDSLFHQLITHPHVLHLSPSDIHWDTFYLHNIFLTHTFYTSLQAVSTGTFSTCINKENTSSLAGLYNTKTQFRSSQSNKKYAVQRRGKLTCHYKETRLLFCLYIK